MSSEFRVNDVTYFIQDEPDVARLADGGHIVVWRSLYDLDGFASRVVGQRYDAAGDRVGGERVLSHGGLEAAYPRVAALDGGGFAIAYEAGPVSYGETDAFVRVFDADGAARGSGIRVNPVTDDTYLYAAEVSALPGGGFMAFYSGDEYDADGGFDSNGSYARAFDADGTPRGGLIHVNRPDAGDQQAVAAARLSNGTTIAIWDDEYGAVNAVGNDVDAVSGRLFGPDGRPLGPEFSISGENAGVAGGFNLTKTDLAVAALKAGRFVAVWHDTVMVDEPGGGTDFSHEIQARIFRADGTPEGALFRVNAIGEYVPEHAAVTALDGGGFVIAWEEPLPNRLQDPANDGREYANVYAQAFDEMGRALGGNVVLSEGTIYGQELPELAALAGGGYFAVWQDEAIDPSYEGIAGRRIEMAPRNDASPGADVILGGPGPDRIEGWDGVDRIEGRGGDDVLDGGRGSDTIDGGSGNDVIDGNRGQDRITGGSGDDTIEGGTSADTIEAGSGNDTVLGGSGADIVLGGSGDDRIVTGSGADTVSGGSGNDTIEAGSGSDVVEGGSGRDTIAAASGNDEIVGGSGDDRIDGGSGNDRLVAGSGDDRLTGGRDDDELFGGSGADVFHFDRGGDADVIRDFRDDEDTIELDGFDFAGGTGRNSAFGAARQVGDDVVFDFGGGDRLTVEDATLAQLENDLILV